MKMGPQVCGAQPVYGLVRHCKYSATTHCVHTVFLQQQFICCLRSQALVTDLCENLSMVPFENIITFYTDNA